MNEFMLKGEKLENLIYEIRGVQVMLDSDLARLYECKNGTKQINLAVKRHKDRFPERFVFQLTEEEARILRFQFETTNNMSRTLPYVFTEQGVAMLATVIRTDVAAQVSIRIMDAFVLFRKYISSNLMKQKYINDLVFKDHEKLEILETYFEKLEEKKKSSEIYFHGQIYDAYSKIQEIFASCKKKLIIIDSYADNTVLDIIKRLDIDVLIITRKNNLLTKQDIINYNSEYHNLRVVYNDTFHDRYFILDNSLVYHCGASINRIGYKTFSINLIQDRYVSLLLINRVKDMLY